MRNGVRAHFVNEGSSDMPLQPSPHAVRVLCRVMIWLVLLAVVAASPVRSEEHTSELQSHSDLHSFPTRRSSDLAQPDVKQRLDNPAMLRVQGSSACAMVCALTS